MGVEFFLIGLAVMGAILAGLAKMAEYRERREQKEYRHRSR